MRIANTLILILFLSQLSLISSAQEEESTVVEYGEMPLDGPFWIKAECQDVSCPGLKLEINSDGSMTTISDLHSVEWSGLVNSTISWTIKMESQNSNFVFDIIAPESESSKEEVDFIDLVPITDSSPDDLMIDATSSCRLDFCEETDYFGGLTIVGALENSSDKDSFGIVGNSGDVILISHLVGSANMDLEIWVSESSEKFFDRNIPNTEITEELIEYPPNGDLWIRITHDGEDGYHPYELAITRFDSSKEAPEGGELTSPWSHGKAINVSESELNTFYGHVAESDSKGDAILISAGAKVTMSPICSFSSETRVGVFLHEFESDDVILISEANECPKIIKTTLMTKNIEFRISSNFTISWMISFEIGKIGDLLGVGDAPDSMWRDGEDNSRWPTIIPGENENHGWLGVEDSVDVFAIEIEEKNGTKVRLVSDEGARISFQIHNLDQNDWSIVNSSNGAIITLDEGMHALRVEGRGLFSQDYEYRFVLEDSGPAIIENNEFEDFSKLFTEFYILAGIILIFPFLIVLWWNRGNILHNAGASINIENHEKVRLKKLREMMIQSENNPSQDEEVIENALKELGESVWEEVAEEWGQPIISHFTGQIQICAWRIGDDSEKMLIGVRAGSKNWDMAAIRLHSPEGSRLEIVGVSPKKIYLNDEVFLEKILAEEAVFFRVEIAGSPSFVTFHLSGIVDGKPVAAVPRGTIGWTSEE